MGRTIKRLIIIFVYLLIFFLIGLTIYFANKPAPTCNDGKRNQKEEGVDCGGPCEPCPEVIVAENLKITESSLMPTSEGTFDLVAKIYNPNDLYGGENFNAVFSAKNAQGVPVGQLEVESFILPKQEKYVMAANVNFPEPPSSLEISTADIGWEKFSSFSEPEIIITNKEYNLISSGVGYSELKGILRNNSPYDFKNIQLKAVLRDEGGAVVTVNSTDMQTILSREEREFRMFWPRSFPGEVRKVEVQVDVNFFQNENFVKRFLEGRKFQER